MDLSQLDDDAVRATQRLIHQGYEAYLVGGCVRDLLLGREPKDYDIATAARPQQVKRVFPRNCRIIGRRFKLAHLHFHGNTKILECSTFRRSPQPGENGDDVLITRDNEFGTTEEDALRRDFTVNALFLDPTRDTILDFANGLQDLQARVIRTIGDPRVRFREDPVRILRAAKFAGRLGFAVEPETFAAMCETSGDLVRSAPPRLFEEILRLLRSGHALDSFQLLRDVGALKSLVPVVADFLTVADHDQRLDFWRLLQALDHHVQDGHKPPNGVLLGALLLVPVLAKVERNPARSPSSIAEELLSPFCAALRLPRRDAGCVKRVCGVQHRFLQADEEKRFRIEGFLHGPYFLEALELFELRAHANEYDLSLVDRWKDLAERAFGHGGQAPGGDDHHGRDDGDEEAGEGRATEAGDRADRPADTDEEGGTAADIATEGAEPPPTANPWAQEHEPGRRRRRRRRRRRGGQRDDDATGGPAETVAGEHGPVDAGDTAPLAARDDDASDAPPSLRIRHIPHDVVHPEGAEDDTDPEAPPTDDFTEPASEADATMPAAAGGPAAGDAITAEPGHGEPGRRRRRRRRRRGRDRGGDGAFPPSDAPAPHGEAVDRASGHHEPPGEPEVQLDPDGPAPEALDEASRQGRDGEGGDLDEAGPDGSESDEATAPGEQAEGAGPGDGERRRRRRRRRRGRGRHRDGQPDGGATEVPELQGPMLPDNVGRVERPRPQQPQQQQQRQRQQQQQQHGQQRPRDERQGRPHERQHERGNRRERHRDRDRDRNRGRGSPRDVDVVPRHRDRRGEVDVIEPAALDLSAFDVELDPKRVPTFGSIVEGKGRPKRRGPRVPDERLDDYKPPPPPGSDSPGAPPPPPPADDTPDTFGDW